MKNVTIYTLAEELNMTPSMISRAFNPDAKISAEKRRLVLETAKKYNFSLNRMASRLSMKSVRIGILINSRFSVNTDKMIAGIETAYASLKDYKIEYDITHINPQEVSLECYTEALFRYKDFDGIIITGMSSSKYTDIITSFYEFNPNIVQVQAINEEVEYLFSSKHDEKIASSLAAEFLYNCLRKSERKNIILFTGEKESTLHSSAESAFKSSCEAFGLKLLDSINMKDNEEYLKEITPKAFEKYNRDVDGIYITSGLSISLCEFLEENGYDIPFVAFDVYEEIKTYMEKGIVSAAISQNVSNQMATAFEMLVKYLITGESVPDTLDTDVQLVLKSNMHQFE